MKHFFDLPQEIQDQVYYHALFQEVEDRDHWTYKLMPRYRYQDGSKNQPINKPAPNCLHLLLVSHKVNSDVQDAIRHVKIDRNLDYSLQVRIYTPGLRQDPPRIEYNWTTLPALGSRVDRLDMNLRFSHDAAHQVAFLGLAKTIIWCLRDILKELVNFSKAKDAAVHHVSIGTVNLHIQIAPPPSQALIHPGWEHQLRLHQEERATGLKDALKWYLCYFMNTITNDDLRELRDLPVRKVEVLRLQSDNQVILHCGGILFGSRYHYLLRPDEHHDTQT